MPDVVSLIHAKRDYTRPLTDQEIGWLFAAYASGDVADEQMAALLMAMLGAGRARKEDRVSHTAGVRCLAKPGDYVRQGEYVLELHADDPNRFGPALEAVEGALAIGSEPPPRASLIVDQVGA